MTVENDKTLLDVAMTMADNKIESVVVVNLSQELIGSITKTDILRAITKYGKNFF